MDGLSLGPADLEHLKAGVALLDMLAVAVFAISGALVAARREMDPIGFIFLGTVTGLGGGTFRDLVLGQPVFWTQTTSYLWTCIGASLLTFWAARLLNSRYTALVWMDAVGIAMFAVTGTQKAMLLGHAAVVCVLMGVMTATLGGLIRDIMAAERSLLFHREIYVTATICGGSAYLVLEALALPMEMAALGGFLAGFATRAAAIAFGLKVPNYKRPDRPLDGPQQ